MQSDRVWRRRILGCGSFPQRGRGRFRRSRPISCGCPSFNDAQTRPAELTAGARASRPLHAGARASRPLHAGARASRPLHAGARASRPLHDCLGPVGPNGALVRSTAFAVGSDRGGPEARAPRLRCHPWEQKHGWHAPRGIQNFPWPPQAVRSTRSTKRAQPAPRRSCRAPQRCRARGTPQKRRRRRSAPIGEADPSSRRSRPLESAKPMTRAAQPPHSDVATRSTSSMLVAP